METATLTEFMALNDQLVALAQAGVPVDVDLGLERADWPRGLEKINAEVARRITQGLPLADALEAHEGLGSSTYRSVVQLGLESKNLSAALDASTQLAETTHSFWSALRLAAIYPIIVCFLVYVGLVACCLFFVPLLEDFYHSMELPAGRGLVALQVLKNSLPYWAAIPPLVLLLLVWRIAFSRPSSVANQWIPLHWSPGVARAHRDQRAANFAGALATLLEGGIAFPRALRAAAGMWNDRAIAHDIELLAAGSTDGHSPADQAFLTRLPPFLRWAMFPTQTAIEPVRALRMAERLYRDSARHRLERLRILAPILACVVIGGSVTLLYALALFLPVVEMIRGLAL